MNKGWISIERALQDHWLFDDDRYFRWWITVLMKVNHTREPQKFLLGDRFFYVNRGQASFSLNTWCDILNNKHTNFKRKTIRRFFAILEDDNMIKYETLGKGNSSTSLITVTNYEDYQGSLDQRKNRRGTEDGQKRGYNIIMDNNEDNEYKTTDAKWYKWFCESWVANSLEHKRKKSYLRTLSRSSQENLKVILKDFTEEDVKKAIVGLMIQRSFPNQQEFANEPTHLLKDEGVYIGKYLAAYESNDREIYGKIKKFE